MESEKARTELLARYAQAIDRGQLEALAKVRGLSGIFAGSVTDAYFQSGTKVMVVGREPRGWDEGADGEGRRGLAKATAEGDSRTYLARMMRLHEKVLGHPPGDSKFFHFYKRLQRDVAKSTAPGSVAWANLLCVSHRKGSPVTGLGKRDAAHFGTICEWSRALVRAQVEVLRPDLIFFVTSPSYDRHLKPFIDIDPDAGTRHVHVPQELWEFRAHGARAFRTRHPRILASSTHRKQAIRLALAEDPASTGPCDTFIYIRVPLR